jgi:hypothetical protein
MVATILGSFMEAILQGERRDLAEFTAMVWADFMVAKVADFTVAAEVAVAVSPFRSGHSSSEHSRECR